MMKFSKRVDVVTAYSDTILAVLSGNDLVFSLAYDVVHFHGVRVESLVLINPIIFNIDAVGYLSELLNGPGMVFQFTF